MGGEELRLLGGKRDVGFFFSSRRRHTRFDCDWSSDVCSSDLDPGKFDQVRAALNQPEGQASTQKNGRNLDAVEGVETLVARSEERRVGKECRSRWAP